MDNIDMLENNYKRELINTIAIITALCVCIILAWFVGCFEEKLDLKSIENNYLVDSEFFVAEKLETAQYLISIVTFPIGYIIFSVLYNRIFCNKKDNILYKKINKYIMWVCTALVMAMFVVIVFKQKSYFSGNLVYKNLAVCIPIMLLANYIWIKKWNIKYKKIGNIIFYLAIILIMALVSFLYINPIMENNGYEMHHLNAYYYPVQKIVSGLTPGVDFNSLYGYYSYFFALIMQLNINSMLLFTIIVSVMVIIILLCIFKVLRYAIKDKLVLFCTFMSIIYCFVIQQFINCQAVYLQYFPHRVMFPALFLAYAVIYLKNIKKREKNYFIWYKIIGFIISSLALFWNLDVGIVVLGTWTIAMIYEELIMNSMKDRRTIIKLLQILLMAILSVALYMGLLEIITYVRTGTIMNLKNTIFGQSNFIGSGFCMMKMELWHPWIILAIVYVIGLSTALNFWINKKDNKTLDFEKLKKNMLILALSILGCGIFTYYQGRSHNLVFYSVLYPAIILLGIYIDYLILSIKKRQKEFIILKYILTISLVSAFTIVSVTVAYNLLFNGDIQRLYNKKNIDNGFDYSGVDVINDNIPNIDYLIEFDSYYYRRYNLKDRKKMPSHVDLFTYSDGIKFVDILEDGKNLCISKVTYSKLMNKYKNIKKDIEEKYFVFSNDKYVLILHKDNIETDKILSLGFEKN